MLEIGTICMKIAGRDAGKTAVIIDILEEPYVLIDGEVRRRKCNIRHIEPMGKKIDIKKNASHADVLKALGIKEEKKKKEKKEKASRPRKIKTKKATEEKAKKKKERAPKEKKLKAKKA